jgi:drug/metabolite transporter (DMT)-like permease
MVVGALTQLAATLPLLWAMAVVGLAIAITLSLGTSLITTAMLGRFVLGERVSGQSLGAIGLLIAAVVCLTFGVEGAATLPSTETGFSFSFALAIAVSCVAGVIYGLLNVSVRRSVTGGVPAGFVALVIPTMGVVCLAPACFWRLGPSGILATPAEDALVMLVSGLLNVIAWFAIIRGLQTTSAVHANVLTASQVAMAALAGILLFEEAITLSLVAGVVMTIAGMVMIDRPLSP